MPTTILPCKLRPVPWGDLPADWILLGRPAREHLSSALRSVAGLAHPDDEFVLPENLLLSAEFLAEFVGRVADLRQAGNHSEVLRAQLGEGAAAARSRGRSSLSDLSSEDEGLALPLLAFPGGSDLPTTIDELFQSARGATGVTIDPLERTQLLPSPRAYADKDKEGIEVAASTRIAIYLEHRSHLQQASLEMLGAQFLRALDRPRWLMGLRFLWERFRPGARRLFSQIGRGCSIHPTAIIEGSSLGTNCDVGAYAIVRGSVLGDDVSIEDGAHVQMSSLGDMTRVARQTSVFASVLMEGAHSAQSVMQMSVLGRHSATTSASWFVDVRLNGTVRVEGGEAGALLDSGTRFLGCDMGHNSFLGAGVTVAAGRMLPSNARIVSDPQANLGTLGEVNPLDGGGGIYAVRDGRLERIQ